MFAADAGGAGVAAFEAAADRFCRGADFDAAALAAIPWLTMLSPEDGERARRALRVRAIEQDAMLCRQGEPAAHWFGVLDGVLAVSSCDEKGRETTIAGIRAGGWFGEGSVLKREAHRYQARALRDSRVALLPSAVFHELLQRSLPFNRFLMAQLNERLSHFIAARAVERARVPEVRVAGHLIELCNPTLYTGAGLVLRLRQCELAALAGLSRQRVNLALASLHKRGAIRIDYGGVHVLDLERLRAIAEGLSPDA